MKAVTIRKHFLSVATAVAFLLAGCSRPGDINILSHNIDSISPDGLRAVSAVISLTVENNSIGFTLSDIEGTVYVKDRDFATFTADPVRISARTTETYPVNCAASLCEGVSLFDLISLANTTSDDMKVDFRAVARTKSGLKKKVRYEKVSLEDLSKK